MPSRDVLMIPFTVFGMNYVPEQHHAVEPEDPRSLIADWRVQRRPAAHAFDLQARAGKASANL